MSSPRAEAAGRRDRLVLGTAGHIDHGKTALVRALTGVDTDRLPEERARGITIALGFAPLELPDGSRLSVVDVPGHERLVRTMVAGASGIDLVLLVVAADEGVMPQTREHLAICELLGIADGAVALTKVDLVDAEMAELAESDVRDALAATALRDVPLVRVSARTGAGIDALRERLAAAAAASRARTPRTGPPRLWIDRAFSARGFGSVVTGTLIGGALETGAELELLPAGRRARVRGLQSHGRDVERAEPGVRTAVNLQGVELAELPRGGLLTPPGALACTGALDVELHWLEGAPPVAVRTSCELLVGTAERRARVSPIGADRIEPGGRGFARIHLEGEGLPLLPGDRFVVQGFARTDQGGSTWGGGRVLDAAPPRRRRRDPALRRDLERLATGGAGTDVAVRVERSGLAGIAEARLRRETGLDAAPLSDALAELEAKGDLARTPDGLCLAADALGEIERRLEAALADFHAREPLRPGMTKGALAGALPENVAPAALELARARRLAAGALREEGDRLRLAGHAVSLSDADRALADRLARSAREAGLEPPTLREWSESLGAPTEHLRALLAHLVREGALVAAPGDLWFDREAVDALRERVRAHLRERGALETPAYKELIGTSRRHAVPLMELFDAERLTLRVENRRVLRGER